MTTTSVLFLILGAVLGWLGMWLLITAQGGRFSLKHPGVPEPKRRKQKNIGQLLLYLEDHEEIYNDDVEKLLGVSDATAERYLDDLEKAGIIRQVGEGRGTHYRRIGAL